MGSGWSRASQLPTNAYVQRMASPEALSPEHPFWNTMLSFDTKTPKNKLEWQELEETLEETLKRFSANNLKSGNLGALVQIFLWRSGELKAAIDENSSMFVWQTFNALFVLRVCIKHFVERLKEEDILREFEAVPHTRQTSEVGDGPEAKAAANGPVAASTAASTSSSVEPSLRYEALINALIDIVTSLPQSDLTYGLHTECVTTLIQLLSSPVVSTKPAFQLRSYRAAMLSHRAPELTSVLMDNFAEQKVAPATYLSGEGGSIVLGLALGMWSILTLGYSSVAAQPSEAEAVATRPLADFSLLLLLILTNHCTDSTTLKNPYRSVLFTCTNSYDSSEASRGASTSTVGAVQVDFGRLFRTLCDTLCDESTLLLYLLVHRNPGFKSHVLASSEIERVVVPILRTLYNAPVSNNHHIYMSLIVLLILSEEDLFNTSVHDVFMKTVEWYTERALHDISLGGLLILVVIRTIQYNMLKMRDKYLHTNCLAALANMSSQFKNLHPYVSQRIVSMFETLAKKHARLVNTLNQSGDIEGIEEDSPIGEALADVTVLEEVLRMILEIINSCLVNQTKSNANLIYTLLYKKEIFEPFATHPSFQDLSQNLQTVIMYFNMKLDQFHEKKDRTLSVHEIQDVIRQTALQFPREKLTKFPDLKFKYVEEEQPEDFFVPYIWTLALSRIYWKPSNVKLASH